MYATTCLGYNFIMLMWRYVLFHLYTTDLYILFYFLLIFYWVHDMCTTSHVHMTYIYIYIYMCVYVCMCTHSSPIEFLCWLSSAWVIDISGTRMHFFAQSLVITSLIFTPLNFCELLGVLFPLHPRWYQDSSCERYQLMLLFPPLVQLGQLACLNA